VGFEPTHALTRLADFESAPLGLLGTSPRMGDTRKIVSQDRGGLQQQMKRRLLIPN
jgi:hypothetical protein